MRELTNVSTSDFATFFEESEEHGVVSEATLEALALEHDLDDDELAALRAELESRGVRVEAATRC